MYTTISFPGLGLELNPPKSFDLGPVSIHIYGIIIAVGLLLAVWYCGRRATAFGLTEDSLLDGVLLVTPFAFICARIYYCAFSWETYAADPISVFYIWQGGIAIYGGVIGAIIGIAVYCKVRKLCFPAVLDLVSLGFLIGQTLGRWGNFFNREAFGAETQSFLRMGLYNTRTGSTEYHHPTFLYESVWNLVGFVLLHKLSKKKKYDGQVALAYVAWYGLGRAFIEGLRTDSLYLGSIRVSQLLAAISCVVAVAALGLLSRREPKAAAIEVEAEAETDAEAEVDAETEVETEAEVDTETEVDAETAVEAEAEEIELDPIEN